MEERPDFTAYPTWLHDRLSVDLASHKRVFQLNQNASVGWAQECSFFKELSATLKSADEEYQKLHHVPLLAKPDSEFRLLRKDYESVVNKSFRENIRNNKSFPEPPSSGWTLPAEACHRINDSLRGELICRYLDGPPFLAERLTRLAAFHSLRSETKRQERDSGYYAIHFYVFIPMSLAGLDGKLADVSVSVEIQLATQLQDLLRALTHGIYERLRISEQEETGWMWDGLSPRFRSSFLGHTLQMIEGLLVSLRNEVMK